MDYSCGKFGDCSYSRYGSILRTDRQTDTQTDADERLTPATLIDVSNNVTWNTVMSVPRDIRMTVYCCRECLILPITNIITIMVLSDDCMEIDPAVICTTVRVRGIGMRLRDRAYEPMKACVDDAEGCCPTHTHTHTHTHTSLYAVKMIRLMFTGSSGPTQLTVVT